MWGLLLKFGAPALFGVAIIGTIYYQHNRIEELNSSLGEARSVIDTQNNTISSIRQISEKNRQRLQQFRNDVKQIRSNAAELEKTLSKHDLRRLSESKPGLIEQRVNDGTDDIFKDIEDASDFTE